MLILAATTAIYSYLVGPLLKFIFIGEESKGGTLFRFLTIFTPSLSAEPERLIYVLIAFLLAVSILKGISYAAQFYLMGYIGQRVIFDLRKELFDSILSKDISFFWEKNSGDLTSRITTDCEKVEQSVTYALSSAVRDTVQIIVLICLCFYLDYRLTLISFIALIITGIPLGLFGLRLKEITIEVHNRLGDIASISSDYINGIQTVHLFSIRKFVNQIFGCRLQNFLLSVKKSLFIRAIQSPVMEVIGVIGICLTIIYARQRITSGDLKPEHFISLFATILMMYNPIKNISRMNNFFTSGIAGAKRIFEVIDTLCRIEENPHGIRIDTLKKGIELRHVSISFGGREILTDINLTIPAGKKIGIAGESGAGKSTIIMLITRMIKANKGEVLLDEQAVSHYNLESLRGLFSVVSQDVILFNDTIYNNIRIGKIDAREEEIIEAAKKANLYDFINSLPAGLSTEIGERGIKLSGGERQRLAIARAFLKDAPIIILDEATSSLDSRNEEFIQNILEDLMSNRTAIIVSHRLSFLRDCNHIYVIMDGRIKESGRFYELLDKKGIFYQYYTSQNMGEML